jgi:hypothetical protein
MPLLRHLAVLFAFLAAFVRPASASAFTPASPGTRVGGFEVAAQLLAGELGAASHEQHQGIGAAYDENASGYRFAAGGAARVNKVGPHPEAQGPHTSFKRDPTSGKVTGYTEFDAAGNPVKRFRGEGKPHGGVDPPFVLEPKPGKGPGSPPKVPRAPRPDELPKGYDHE